MSATAICARAVKLFACDEAHTTQPLARGPIFLILGWRRNTRADKGGQWYKNGEPYHFDYLRERVVASGQNIAALWRSAVEYKRLCGKRVDG